MFYLLCIDLFAISSQPSAFRKNNGIDFLTADIY